MDPFLPTISHVKVFRHIHSDISNRKLIRFSLNIIPPTSLPEQKKLDQNYPNPFNPITIISYEIPRGEFVELNIFNLRGNKITTLVNEFQNPGIKSYQWNGTNDNGNSVSAGVYIYTIQAGNYLESKKMIFLK